MVDRDFIALVYHHPRGLYVAECVAFPEVSSEGDSPAAALSALTPAIAEAVRTGEPETNGGVFLTTMQVLAYQYRAGAVIDSPETSPERTYMAVVTPDLNGTYASYCPALGVASQGETVIEALQMLREASQLALESQNAPERDELVYVERIGVPVPDASAATPVQ